MAESAIDKIRAELPLLRAWHLLDLPGTAHVGDQRSPLREDKKASFSIYPARGHLRWHDHGTGEGGDVVDLWAKVKGISVKDAIAEILGLSPSPNRPATAPKSQNKPVSAPEAIRWPPDLREPTEAECRALGALRGLEPAAFDLAGRLGALKVATVYHQKCWILTDPRGRAAAARRFDGELFASGKKSFALPGSHKDWPPGLATLEACDKIVLVEGEPDYFAALQLALDSPISFRPAAILGSGCRLGPEALSCLRGKKILILPHNDPAGQKALEAWVSQLTQAQAGKVVSQALPFEHDDLCQLLNNPGQLNPLDLLKGFDEQWHPGPQGV